MDGRLAMKMKFFSLHLNSAGAAAECMFSKENVEKISKDR